LESKKKTNLKLFFPSLNLNFLDGRIMIDSVLNYEFENTTIKMNNFNSTISYDGIFTFVGIPENLSLNSNKDNLNINFKN